MRALACAAPFAVAVLVANALPAKAQDIVIVPPVNQTNPAGNTNGPVTHTALDVVTLLSIITSEDDDVQSVATAVARIQGLVGVPNSPVIVNQTTNNDGTVNTNPNVANTNTETFRATAIATAGAIDLTNTTILVGTLARSLASADAAADSAVTQLNTRTTNNNANTAQAITQTNTNTQSFYVTAIATAKDVFISSSGPVTSISHGVSAESDAETHAHAGSDVSQTNTNILTGNLGSPLTQNQNNSQSNTNSQRFFATSVAVSKDATVTREGDTTADENGVNAVTQSAAFADIGSGNTVTQRNLNSENANTSTSSDDLMQSQQINQTNQNGQSFFATAVAVTGDATASNKGNTKAGGHGVNASAVANAEAMIDDAQSPGSSVTQSNSNALAGGTIGAGSDLSQTQIPTQTNNNEQKLFATAVAVAGEANASNRGDVEAGLNGVNAESRAGASSSISTAVSQQNTNSLIGSTSGGVATFDNAALIQSEILNQTNTTDLLSAATSVAVAHDATASSKGNIKADGNGVNAVSDAQAIADNGSGNTVTQSNSNTQTASTGPGAAARLGGQNGTINQTNQVELSSIATAIAVAGDARARNEGNIYSGGNGVNAESNAGATATAGNTIGQSNTHLRSASATGNGSSSGGNHPHLAQGQGVTQTNTIEDEVAVATSVAIAGDASASNKGNIEAKYNGINAVSKAESNASVANVITQTNSDTPRPCAPQPCEPLTASTTGNGGDIGQGQFVNQSNEAEKYAFATAISVADDAKVRNKGDIKAEYNGINAVSSTAANANIGSDVGQQNDSTVTAATTGGTNSGFPSSITQSQEPVGQTNDNDNILAATALGFAGDVKVFNKGNTTAKENGVNAVSESIVTARIGPDGPDANTTRQANATNMTARTGGQDASITQTQRIVGVEDDQTGQLNENSEIMAATSVAGAGDVKVFNKGNTKAEENGVNAVSHADAGSSVANAVNQRNDNNANAVTLGGGARIGQAQLIGNQTNDNFEFIAATSVAHTGDVKVKASGDMEVGVNGVNAVSHADAGSTVNKTVNQSNTNSMDASTGGDGAFIAQGQLGLGVAAVIDIGDGIIITIANSFGGGQTVSQANANGEIAFATSLAGAGDVTVESGGAIGAGETGVNAASIAVADSSLNSSVRQTNENSLSADTQGGIGTFNFPTGIGNIGIPLPIPALVVQNQTVDQTNENGELLAATSISRAGDVYVSRTGDTSAPINAVDASSVATSHSEVLSTVNQSNSNSASASTTGDGAVIAQAPFEITVPFDIGDGFIVGEFFVGAEGGQDVEQTNTNLQALAATSIAHAGDVEVDVEGNSEGGEIGVNAVSSADSYATVDAGDTINQTNTNSLSGSTEGLGGLILQDQLADQSNINGQALIAGAAAFSDHVDVTVKGDSNGGKTGVNAESKAKAVAGVKNSVNQTNDNRLGASTTGDAAIVTQSQDAEQVNFNADLSVAAADAQSEDVTVNYTGNSTGGEKAAINAESKAVALAGVKKSIDQKNINGPVVPPPPDEIEAVAEEPVDAEAQIERGPLPEPVIPTGSTEGILAILTQGQTAEQINFNGEIVAAASFAKSDDVKVFSDGSHYGGENAIKAKSEAVAGAGVFTEVTQLNDNELNGSATGPLALMLQTQGALQVNANLESGNAVALAFSDDVRVKHSGDLESGKTAIVAASSAEAGAVVVQKANQTNENSADAVGSLILQLQGALQINANIQDGNAFALAVADDVKVKQSGATNAGKDGINAKSTADAEGIVVQKAEQLNDNSAHIALGASEDGTGDGSGIPLPDILDGFGIGIQGQLLGQLNINLQSGTAISTAISKDVKVDSENDPASGNGVVAVSAADALGVVYQDATQTNQNGASIELPADGLGIGLQIGLGLQANLNAQEGLAVVTARSGNVYVDQDGSLDAGKDGVKAISSAEANGVVFQAVEQNNIDGKTVAPVETDEPVEEPVFGVGVQLEGVLQANLSGQEGVSVATAKSGKADIDKWGGLVTGEDGLVAVSSAKADAAVIQKADQSNENDLDATGAIVAQIQIPLQLNVSTQRGAAIATAISDKASVNQSGDMDVGGNGVVAISKAEADAIVVQDAKQLNDNSATATLEGELSLPGDDPVPNPQLVGDLDGPLGLALQIQGGLQLNASEQHGVAISTAISDDVKVKSENDPAGGIGVKAASEAEAEAVVFQKADQTNTNNVAATFKAPDVTIPEPGEEIPDEVRVEQTDGLDVALQVQLFGQVNISDQAGLAVATAISDDVEVEQGGTLEAGGDGMNVKSSADADAFVVQKADQSNLNTATATFEGPSVDITAEGESVDVGVFQTDGLDLALQGQLIGQLNVSTQRGAAISTAISDDVEVEKTGGMTAGADGINAKSAAEAEGGVFQAASQSNTNSATAIFEGAQAKITATAGDGEEDTPEEIDEDATVQLSQVDGVDVGIQGQAVGQLNVNAQGGVAISTAISGDVDVESQDDPAGDDGVVASSDAHAKAVVVQTAVGEKTEDGYAPGQSNINSATATFHGAQADLMVTAEDQARVGIGQTFGDSDLGLQGQLVGQVNINQQGGLAVATAISDDADAEQEGVLEAGGNGMVVTSSAKAEAPVIQIASQSNENSATATFEGDTLDVTTSDTERSVDGTLTDGAGSNVALQGQLVGQINYSTQGGAAIATAVSDDVEVDQSGSMTVGKDGIVAASSAKAEAPVFQAVSQSNDNSAEATLFGGEERGSENLIGDDGGLDFALQGQLVGQVNVSGQRGLAVATAVSDDVRVKSQHDPAGGNGVVASSDANAKAVVAQTVDQSNSNSADVTFEGAEAELDFTINEFEKEVVQLGTGQFDNSDIALQGQLVGQLNINDQAGLAVSTAISDDVRVKQDGTLEADGDGFKVTSVAEASGAVVQKADQKNENTATATFEGAQTHIMADGPSVAVRADQFDSLDLALQGQLVGQLNVSTQRGAAISTAISDDVKVDKTGGMTAGADGINAKSAAQAEGGVYQAATQSNTNSAVAEFKGAQANIMATAGDGEDDDPEEIPENATVNVTQVDGPDIGIQGQAVGQLNVNAQGGVAISTAISGDVKVKTQDDPAGGDAVVASSEAKAKAAVVQTAVGEKTEDGYEPGQSNTNSATATFEGAQDDFMVTAEDGSRVFLRQQEAGDLALQGQLVGQANLSEQRGLAVATAISDDVKAGQTGVLDAGGNGMVATSSAKAEAPVFQAASQKNDNEAEIIFEGSQVDATFADADFAGEQHQTGNAGADISLQGQLVGQINLNAQGGAAIATAISSDVEVEQAGSMTVGQDGVVASSEATAIAPVVQAATQVNDNSAEASLFGGQPDTIIGVTQILDGGDVDLALQGQAVGQANFSVQRGASIATALSGDVEVESGDDPAGGNGVVATSGASAIAPVAQLAEQSNTNSASADFAGQQITVELEGEGEIGGEIFQQGTANVALQGQLVGQINLSGQRGLSVATAVSDDVELEQAGDLDVGQSGLIATSSAEAKAPIYQKAEQQNTNEAKATFDGQQAGLDLTSEGSVDAGVEQSQGFDFGLQGQLVGQVNLNGQHGVAIATAESDDVEIEQAGALTTGVDGVVGTSSAVADAAVWQVADQSNKNNAEAIFSGNQADIRARAGDGEEDDPEPVDETVHIGVEQTDGVNVALQGQIVGQANLNRQSGLSVATAISDDVKIKSQTDPSGGNGVVGTSSALATAPLVQTADQTNENSATATFEGSQADIDFQAEDRSTDLEEVLVVQIEDLNFGLQGQLVGQINLSGQHGLAVATAVSDDVKIEQSGPLETGASGIVGTSSAKAVAPVVQEATQSNVNTAAMSFEGPQADIVTDDEFILAIGLTRATADVGLQGQILGQVNLSGQLGGAVSTAISDDVHVDQSGAMNAGTDGVVATSSADAVSALVQTANQSNANSADQIFEPSEFTVTVGDEQETNSLFQDIGVGLQGQLAGQVNLSAQGGLSVATAVSGEVKVKSSDDPAGNDGVVANSSAHAGAAVIQTVGKEAEDGEEGEEGEWKDKELEPGQSNVNNASIALPGEEEENGDTEALVDLDGDFGLQVQGALQVNASLQGGAAISTAVSDKVRIDQDGELTTGNNGLVGTSSAVSGALVAQTAVQSNENTAEIVPVEEPLEPIEVVELPVEIELDALTIQGQAIGQLNVNVQGGAAIGLAFADEVSIHQSGTMDVGGNGIVATSAAAVGAVVVQSADQSNTNTLATAADAPVQGQLFGQLNLNVQAGLAVGVAIADEVEVESENDPAAENGIIASSTAVTVALVEQSAYQSNDNTLDSGDNQAFGGQLGGQLNVSVQKGLAVGVALSDDVSVKQTGDMETGGVGIQATSSAGVLAAVKQDVDQSNTNESAPGLVGQANLASQSGLAVALAGSGKVSVVQKGKLTTGKTGIKAVSSASATAKVEQDEYQYSGAPANDDHNYYWNLAATAAFAVADKVSVESDEIDAGGDGVVGISSAFAKALGGNNPIVMADALEAAENEQLDSVVAENFLLVPPSAFAFAKADKVDIHTKGPIVAAGYGVYALSYANAEAYAEDGNSVAIAKSDDVNVVVKDDITAGKHAVYAGSIAVANNNGTDGITEQGNVTVAIKKGTVTGGNGYYGIVVLGGDDNHISIGEWATVTSLSGHAIYGGDEDETVWNDGLVIGIVDLGLGNNAFFNNITGSFYTGSLVNLNGGLLTTAGLLSPGGPGVIQTTALNGSLIQTGTGTYYVDIDMGNAVSDRINATGSASLDGTVTGKIIANPQSGEQTVTILSAAGGANDAGVEATDTALVDYTVGWSGPNDVTLHMDVDFAPTALAKEPWGLGQHLNDVFLGGGPAEMEALGIALLGLDTLGDVENAYWQLSPENFRALPESTLYAGQQFMQDMNSCKVRDGGLYSVIDEDQCLWARVRWRELEVGSNSGTSGYSDEAVAILGGAQWTLNGPWHVGLAGGYENTDVSTNSPRVSSDGDRGHLGGTVKYISGPWLASGTIAGGWTGYDSTRQISFPGFAATAKSDQDISNIGGQLRGAYLMTSGKWYVKPQVDLDVIYVDMDGFTETGGGGAALKVSGTDETVFIATPALELGTQMGFNGVLARPFVRGGVSFYSDADFPILAGFAAAPGVAPFKTTGEIDDVVGNISAGVSLLGTGKGVVTLSYDGAFGDDLESHSASAKASWRY